MKDLTAKETRTLLDIQEDFNIFEEKFREEINRVEIFYEDCKNCDMTDECPNMEEYKKEGIILQKLHEFIQNKGVNSNLHPLTSEDNKKLGEVVSKKDGVLPVTACLNFEIPLFAPKHNYFFIELEDGRRLLYLVQNGLGGNSAEKYKQRMIYR